MDSKSLTLVSRAAELQLRREELITAKRMIESDEFQKFFAERLYKLKKELKNAYDCENMYDLKFVKGQNDTVDKFFGYVDEIETELKFINNELNKIS